MKNRVSTKQIEVTAPPHSADVLKESEAKYRALFETSMIGIVLSDLDEKIIEANDAFLELIGYTRDDLRNGKLTWSTITPDEYDDLDEAKIKEILRYGKTAPFEKVYVNKKGKHVSVLVGAETIQTDPLLSVSFALDISHQKKMEQRKDDFVATVSHELKTPLAVMKVYTDLLRIALDRNAPRDEIERNLDEIDQQVAKLTMIINDFSNLTRVQSGKEEAGRDLFNIRETVADAVKTESVIHDHKIILKESKDLPLVRGSRERLNLAFRNILSNAVRYSPKGRSVRVSIKREGKYAVVSVRDFGIGIAKKDQKAIFDRYYRVDHVNSYGKDGVGIGLYICKEILESHKGKIIVDSAIGKGSKFSCYIPLEIPQRQPKRTSKKR